MSDIGNIFSPFDLIIMLLIASTPGLVVGAAAGAYFVRKKPLYGAIAGATTGCILVIAGWIVYFSAIK
jgi:hypothetical protein